MNKSILPAVLVSLAAALFQSSAVQAQDKAVTVKYDVADCVKKKFDWGVGDKRIELAGIDAIMKIIIADLDPKVWRDAQFLMEEHNGTQIEIRTTKANHQIIESVIGLIRNRMDITVDVETGFYEVDRDYYEKTLKPKFVKMGADYMDPDEREDKEFRKAARLVKSHKTTLDAFDKGQIFSTRRAIPYEMPRDGANMTNEVVYAGVRLETEVRVSSNRIHVEMKLKQTGSELVEWRTRTVRDFQFKEFEMAFPQVRESSSTYSVTVSDGGILLLPLAAVPTGIAKDRIPVYWVRPDIVIGAEQEQLKREMLKQHAPTRRMTDQVPTAGRASTTAPRAGSVTSSTEPGSMPHSARAFRNCRR